MLEIEKYTLLPVVWAVFISVKYLFENVTFSARDGKIEFPKYK